LNDRYAAEAVIADGRDTIEVTGNSQRDLCVWLRSDVDERSAYRVALCQAPDGHRTLRLHPAGHGLPSQAVLCTAVVSIDLLLRRDVIGIAESVKLTSGDPFAVDAHGTWFTAAEIEAGRNRVEWDKRPWLNGLPPKQM
jgi:hypothetical protein